MKLINPKTQNFLRQEEGKLVDEITNNVFADIVRGIPRFVKPEENYAKSFGWQWNKWVKNRSAQQGSGFGLKKLIYERTYFEQYDTKDKIILECGCGGGDDTEILLSFPFSEVHSFDLSNAVDRARNNISDSRLFLSQASIYDIPYPDESFDFVYCHRVLQHTPDPIESLKSICKKVKPGGILFAHSYLRSKAYMSTWRYKYLWLTQKLPHKYIYWYVKYFGVFMHNLNEFLATKKYTRKLSSRWIPFYRKSGQKDIKGLSKEEVIDLERLITFDALTPAHDHPMSHDDLFVTIADEGFEVLHKFSPENGSLQFCTAIKKKN